LWAFNMSRVGRVEREWDEYAIEDGRFDFEAGFFQDTQFTEGDALLVSSPNSAPEIALGASSRASFDAVEALYRAGAIPEGMIEPQLAQAVFEDGLGDFKDGGAQITTALTQAHVDLLAQHGGDAEDLLGGLGLGDVYSQARHRDVEASLSEIMGDVTQDGNQSRYTEEELDAFLDTWGGGDHRFDATEFQQEVASLTPDQFHALDPIAREMMIESRVTDLAVANRNPWEVISLVEMVEDEEERVHLMREVFEKIENTNLDLSEDAYGQYSVAGVLGGDGANTSSVLLFQHMSAVAEDLDEDQAALMMSGARIDLVDQRASEWSSERVLDGLGENKSEAQVLNGLIEDHINWGIENQSYDQLSDNFQAVALAGGPELVNALIDRLGEDALVEILADTASDDPRRLAIYDVALANTDHAALVDAARRG